MTKLLHLSIIVSLLTFMSCSSTDAKKQDLRLWYDKPAKEWMTEALPFGNGYMGAMFFGGIDKERIANMIPDGSKGSIGCNGQFLTTLALAGPV